MSSLQWSCPCQLCTVLQASIVAWFIPLIHEMITTTGTSIMYRYKYFTYHYHKGPHGYKGFVPLGSEVARIHFMWFQWKIHDGCHNIMNLFRNCTMSLGHLPEWRLSTGAKVLLELDQSLLEESSWADVTGANYIPTHNCPFPSKNSHARVAKIAHA